MIAAIIERDHDAGREFFADIGNATQPAWEGRRDGLRGLLTLWEAHGAVLEQAILPKLAGMAAGSLEALRTEQGSVVALAADLARRTADHDAEGLWLTDFERLKALFDGQCRREAAELMPLVGRTAPDDLAEMTRKARALRQGHGA